MTLEVLLSCMHQKDFSLVEASRLTGDVLIINQCDREDFAQVPTKTGTARMFSTRDRGMTRSRNCSQERMCQTCRIGWTGRISVVNISTKIVHAYIMFISRILIMIFAGRSAF